MNSRVVYFFKKNKKFVSKISRGLVRHLSNLGLGTKKLLNFTPSTPQNRADVRNYKKYTMDLDSTRQADSTDMFNFFVAPIFAEIRFFCEADHTGRHALVSWRGDKLQTTNYLYSYSQTTIFI